MPLLRLLPLCLLYVPTRLGASQVLDLRLATAAACAAASEIRLESKAAEDPSLVCDKGGEGEGAAGAVVEVLLDYIQPKQT